MIGVRTLLRRQWRKIYPAWKLPRELKKPLNLAQLRALKLGRNQLYAYSLYYFDHYLPPAIRAHRRYFAAAGRGYGEDAFHAMWYLLLQESRPASALEIGVFRGQIITLWKLLSRHFNFACSIGCVSPFTAAGDTVSQYLKGVDYYEDTLISHRHFSLSLPDFCRNFSTEPEARRFIQSRQWALIYIDGNHDYPVARQDWETCSQTLPPGGIMVLDDAALQTDFQPPCFSNAGHPGPSQVAAEISAAVYQEIFFVGHNRVFMKRI